MKTVTFKPDNKIVPLSVLAQSLVDSLVSIIVLQNSGVPEKDWPVYLADLKFTAVSTGKVVDA